MNLQLSGRRAVVTGGSRGIGLAVARVLATEGSDVALVARDMKVLADVAASLSFSTGRRVVGVAADTGDSASVAAMAAEVAERLGGVDILVNAAANVNLGGFSDEALGDEINVKVGGYLRTARAFAPHMVAQGWGRIINISGLAARHTGSVVGSVRNAAVAAMSKNLADELGAKGINVVTVHPGLTRTDRTNAMIDELAQSRGVSTEEAEREMAADISIGRLVTAEEVAYVIAFLASPLSVALNGEVVAAGGGVLGAIHY
ncbi:short-chain dehydrogenase [Nonomuraea sp. TT08I-71]|nr:short-chain dehydrogenase [Nonomuraea sp. TT08I-71]